MTNPVVATPVPAESIKQSKWTVFGSGAESWEPWLAPFVERDRHRLSALHGASMPLSSGWHGGTRTHTSISEWVSCLRAAWTAKEVECDGAITLFPPQATMLGLLARVGVWRLPIVACAFNIGFLPGGYRRLAARIALKKISYFCVHTRAEIDFYSEWLKLPKSKFRFFPLQKPNIPRVADVEKDQPFAVAIGSACRDYHVFAEAMRRLKLPAVVVAAPHAIKGVSFPDNVTVRQGLSIEECRSLTQRARVCVIPIASSELPAGTVTVVEAMRQGCAIVATKCAGTEDYLEHGRSGLLVQPGDVDNMAEAISTLWQDEALRTSLAENACSFAERECSDEAAGVLLSSILDDAVDPSRTRRNSLNTGIQ
jgi:hypothetical protein